MWTIRIFEQINHLSLECFRRYSPKYFIGSVGCFVAISRNPYSIILSNLYDKIGDLLIADDSSCLVYLDSTFEIIN
jgi:hypothetical protein